MRTRFTVRNEVDFIALAPIVLGFTPKHSLVMMTVDSFHARIDLPEEADYDMFVETLVAPAIKHGIKRVGFVVFDDGDWTALIAQLIARFDRAKVEILAVVQVGEGQYRNFGDDWKPLDLSTHPFTLEAQFNNAAPRHRTRDELVEYVRPCGASEPTDIDELMEKLCWDGAQKVVAAFTRQEAREAVDQWVAVLRSLEPGSALVHDVAIIVAFAAWLSGDGALAWVAVDLADQDAQLTQLITIALREAINPEQWDELNGNA